MNNLVLTRLIFPLTTFVLLASIGCTSEPPSYKNGSSTVNQQAVSNYSFPYNLKSPANVNFLENKLVEISGLSLTTDSSQLVCINDEMGQLFYIAKKSGEILSSLEFGTSGDYEGIEFVNGKCYVVKNNGTLFSIDPSTKEVVIENTFLTSANDVEGLGYWPKRNRLLLACKGSPSGKNNYKESRAIYDFDLKENKLKKKPMFLVTKQAIKDFLAAKSASGISKKVLQKLHILDALSFAPSGIAVHPISQNIYILSSQGNTLFVVNEKGNILHIEFLSKTKFAKPEGIVFDLDGTLYISNEGKVVKGNILEFKMIE